MFDLDLESCPECGASLRVIAVVDDPALVHRILEHVDARERAARAPPGTRAV